MMINAILVQYLLEQCFPSNLHRGTIKCEVLGFTKVMNEIVECAPNSLPVRIREWVAGAKSILMQIHLGLGVA